jgi:hypothetical protein
MTKQDNATKLQAKLLSFAKKYGFEKAELSAYNTLQRIARKLAYNMINNARHVSDACNCKTIRSSHFKAVLQLQSKILAQRRFRKARPSQQTQQGGDPVMAPAFFGVQEHRYFEHDVVAPFETQMHADNTVTRAALNISDGQMVGGALKVLPSFVNSSMIESFVESYNVKKDANKKIKVSKAAMKIMRLSINQTLFLISKHISSNKFKVLTGKVISKTIESHPQYAYLR